MSPPARLAPLDPRHEESLWEDEEGTLRIGRFVAAPADADFATAGAIGPFPAIAFARTSVRIVQRDRPPSLSDGMVAILHDPGQPYLREAVHPLGDRCEWVNVSPRRLRGLGLRPGRDGRFFRRPAVRIPARALLLFRWAAGAASARRDAGPGIERALVEVVRIVAARERRAQTLGRAAAAAGAEDPLTARVREIVARAYEEPLPVEDLASEIGCSSSHLTRRFRAGTGLTPHRYLVELRLREALGRVAALGSDLSAIAHDLGFSSHSHFSFAFRRRFGCTPSGFRAQVERGARPPGGPTAGSASGAEI